MSDEFAKGTPATRCSGPDPYFDDTGLLVQIRQNSPRRGRQSFVQLDSVSLDLATPQVRIAPFGMRYRGEAGRTPARAGSRRGSGALGLLDSGVARQHHADDLGRHREAGGALVAADVR